MNGEGKLIFDVTNPATGLTNRLETLVPSADYSLHVDSIVREGEQIDLGVGYVTQPDRVVGVTINLRITLRSADEGVALYRMTMVDE